MKREKLQWFARGGGIARCGPFKTQVDAVEAMRHVDDAPRGHVGPWGIFPADMLVWPERVDNNLRNK